MDEQKEFLLLKGEKMAHLQKDEFLTQKVLEYQRNVFLLEKQLEEEMRKGGLELQQRSSSRSPKERELQEEALAGNLKETWEALSRGEGVGVGQQFVTGEGTESWRGTFAENVPIQPEESPMKGERELVTISNFDSSAFRSESNHELVWDPSLISEGRGVAGGGPTGSHDGVMGRDGERGPGVVVNSTQQQFVQATSVERRVPAGVLVLDESDDAPQTHSLGPMERTVGATSSAHSSVPTLRIPQKLEGYSKGEKKVSESPSLLSLREQLSSRESRDSGTPRGAPPPSGRREGTPRDAEQPKAGVVGVVSSSSSSSRGATEPAGLRRSSGGGAAGAPAEVRPLSSVGSAEVRPLSSDLRDSALLDSARTGSEASSNDLLSIARDFQKEQVASRGGFSARQEDFVPSAQDDCVNRLPVTIVEEGTVTSSSQPVGTGTQQSSDVLALTGTMGGPHENRAAPEQEQSTLEESSLVKAPSTVVMGVRREGTSTHGGEQGGGEDHPTPLAQEITASSVSLGRIDENFLQNSSADQSNEQPLGGGPAPADTTSKTTPSPFLDRTNEVAVPPPPTTVKHHQPTAQEKRISYEQGTTRTRTTTSSAGPPTSSSAQEKPLGGTMSSEGPKRPIARRQQMVDESSDDSASVGRPSPVNGRASDGSGHHGGPPAPTTPQLTALTSSKASSSSVTSIVEASMMSSFGTSWVPRGRRIGFFYRFLVCIEGDRSWGVLSQYILAMGRSCTVVRGVVWGAGCCLSSYFLEECRPQLNKLWVSKNGGHGNCGGPAPRSRLLRRLLDERRPA